MVARHQPMAVPLCMAPRPPCMALALARPCTAARRRCTVTVSLLRTSTSGKNSPVFFSQLRFGTAELPCPLYWEQWLPTTCCSQTFYRRFCPPASAPTISSQSGAVFIFHDWQMFCCSPVVMAMQSNHSLPVIFVNCKYLLFEIIEILHCLMRNVSWSNLSVYLKEEGIVWSSGNDTLHICVPVTRLRGLLKHSWSNLF